VVFFQILYGIYPFYATDIPELLRVIRRSSGDNLSFPDQRAIVSKEMKDIIRGLLQMDPDQRIHWDQFLYHPIFSSKSQVTQIQQSISTSELFENIKEIMHLEKGYKVTSLDDVLKENYFRYMHERNKIMLMMLALKRTRRLQKDPDYRETGGVLYRVGLVLIRLASMVCEFATSSLTTHRNVFKLDKFEIFCNNSPKYLDVRSLLEADSSMIEKYQLFLYSLRKEYMQTAVDEAISFLKQPHLNVTHLEDKLADLIFAFTDSPLPYKLTHSAVDNQNFLFCIFLLKIISLSPIHLSYYIEGRKFNWDNYKDRIEAMTSDQLKYAIRVLEQTR